MNTIVGSLFSTLSVITGNKNTKMKNVIQCITNAQGINLAGTISGMYNHIIGPKEKLYPTMNMNNPTITNTSATP